MSVRTSEAAQRTAGVPKELHYAGQCHDNTLAAE
jgi:hypothetical protein